MATTDINTEDRAVKRALLLGWRKRCPNCGKGPLLKSYLKVRDNCPVCDQDFSHQRADDGPAYLTIIIVGHILVPLIHVVYVHWEPTPTMMAIGFSVAAITLALYLLPRIKGALIGFQWSKRMHGF